jgi:poly(3-hydroxyoctanoate) depolymerase
MALSCLFLCACETFPNVNAGSRCAENQTAIQCLRETKTFDVMNEKREVHFQTPLGATPDAGWPAVLVFQGSGVGADISWQARSGDSFGGFHQARLTRALLESGFAVLTPEARHNGATYWDTNIPPHAGDWEHSFDNALMLILLTHIKAHTFGTLDASRLYATGISSGGYMTSRMALSYPKQFRALAIQSGSWATCAGVACALPEMLPVDHPPTFFLHGDIDPIVPLLTMTPYAEALTKMNVPVEKLIRTKGHEWFEESPAAITDFFLRH